MQQLQPATADQMRLCGTNTDPNTGISTSKAAMQATGWVFNWDDANTFKPNTWSHGGATFADAYCGYRWGSAAYSWRALPTISLTLSGSGTTTVTFGNPASTGSTKLYLDSVEISSASAQTNSQVSTFGFSNGQILKLEQSFNPNSILLFHSISFQCDSDVSIAPTSAPTADSDVNPYPCTSKNQPIQILTQATASGVRTFALKVLDVESAIVAATAGGTPGGSYVTTGSGAYSISWPEATWDVNAADISGECCHGLSITLNFHRQVSTTRRMLLLTRLEGGLQRAPTG